MTKVAEPGTQTVTVTVHGPDAPGWLRDPKTVHRILSSREISLALYEYVARITVPGQAVQQGFCSIKSQVGEGLVQADVYLDMRVPEGDPSGD